MTTQAFLQHMLSIISLIITIYSENNRIFVQHAFVINSPMLDIHITWAKYESVWFIVLFLEKLNLE